MSKSATILDSQNITVSGNTLSNSIIQSIDRAVIRTNPTHSQLIDVSQHRIGIKPESNGVLYVDSGEGWLTLSGESGGTYYTGQSFAYFDESAYVELDTGTKLQVNTGAKIHVDTFKDIEDNGNNLYNYLSGKANTNDLTANYYNKTATNNLSTTFRSGLATTASLTAYQPKGNYLTEHQSLTAYETKADLTSNYYNKTATNNLSTAFRSGLATTSQLTTYLPLSGAQMTGPIKTQGELAQNSNITSYVRVLGGSDATNGGYVMCCGKEYNSSISGGVSIVVNDYSTGSRVAKSLNVYPDGRLTWVNKNIVRTVNNKACDNSGNVDLGTILTAHQSLAGYATTSSLSAYLPKAGGAMTGSIIVHKLGAMYYTDDTGYLQFSGANSYLSGAYMRLIGNNCNSTLSGGMQIIVNDENGSQHSITYNRNGRLTVNGNDVATTNLLTSYLPTAGGTMTGSITTSKLGAAIKYSDISGYLQLLGANSGANGSYITLFGNEYNSTLSGGAQIAVHDAAGAIHTLSYYRDGKLQVNGDNVVRSVNGTKADNYGNITLSSNGIATINGIQPNESGNFDLKQLSVSNSSLVPDFTQSALSSFGYVSVGGTVKYKVPRTCWVVAQAVVLCDSFNSSDRAYISIGTSATTSQCAIVSDANITSGSPSGNMGAIYSGIVRSGYYVHLYAWNNNHSSGNYQYFTLRAYPLIRI